MRTMTYIKNKNVMLSINFAMANSRKWYDIMQMKHLIPSIKLLIHEGRDHQDYVYDIIMFLIDQGN